MIRIVTGVFYSSSKRTSDQIPNVEIRQRIIMISGWWDISDWTQTLRKTTQTKVSHLKEWCETPYNSAG